MKTAKEILMDKATANNDGFLSGQVKWIVEAMEEYASLKKPKIIIVVRGGMVEKTISTTKNLEVLVADYDSMEEGDLITHWNSAEDEILTEEEFKKKVDNMDHEFKVDRQ